METKEFTSYDTQLNNNKYSKLISMAVMLTILNITELRNYW